MLESVPDILYVAYYCQWTGHGLSLLIDNGQVTTYPYYTPYPYNSSFLKIENKVVP